MTAREHRADIDGLRAVAVISVIFFHFDMGFEGGFVGVDIFFVISGFLITRLIWDEIEKTAKFDFTRFFARRMRRLLPALFVTLLVCLGVGFLVFTPADFKDLSTSTLSVLASVSNFYFATHTGYFDKAAHFKPLLHTWSLSIEEQFYFFWPVALLLLSRALRFIRPVVFAIVILAGSILATWLIQGDDPRAFYQPLFRVYEFAIGASLVWIGGYRLKNTNAMEAIFVLGFVMAAVSIFAFTRDMRFPSINALLPCLGAALMIYAGTARLATQILANPMMRGVGLISYSFYLVHWPIFVFYTYYRVSEISAVERIALVIVSVAMAALMYRFVELPFRNQRPGAARLPSGAFLARGAGAILTLMSVALVSRLNDGFPDRIHRRFTNNPQFASLDMPWHAFYPAGKNSRGEIVLYGDSHARQYADSIRNLAGRLGYDFRVVAEGACLRYPDLMNAKPMDAEACRSQLNLLMKHSRPRLLILAQYWPYQYVTRERIRSSEWRNVTDETLAAYMETIKDGIDRLAASVQASKIMIIGNVPTSRLKSGFVYCDERPYKSAACRSEFPRDEGLFLGGNSYFEKYAHATKNVEFIDPYNSLCDRENCFVVRDRILYYADATHLTEAGAEKVISDNAQSIRALLESYAANDAITP